MGPIGVGKSTLLINLALEDIEAGRGVAVFHPKGALVRDLLERIPRGEADRLTFVDPARREQPLGINALACGDPDLYQLVTHQLLPVFRPTYERFWGPRPHARLR